MVSTIISSQPDQVYRAHPSTAAPLRGQLQTDTDALPLTYRRVEDPIGKEHSNLPCFECGEHMVL